MATPLLGLIELATSEDGTVKVNEALRTLEHTTCWRVLDVVTADPGSPTTGDAVLRTDTDEVLVRLEGSWFRIPVVAGFLFTELALAGVTWATTPRVTMKNVAASSYVVLHAGV